MQGLQTHSVNEMIMKWWKSTREMILEVLNESLKNAFGGSIVTDFEWWEVYEAGAQNDFESSK